MLTRLLVPLDGSELAERALAYATALSIPTAAHLVLVRAVVVHTLPGVDGREPEVHALAEAQQYLTTMADELRARGFAVETATPYGPHPAEWIVTEARLRQCDLIVMTTHGRTGPGRWVFGSVAEAVVAHSPVPVLLDRAWHPAQRELLLTEQPRLLVPLDGSAFAESALELAGQLAQDLGAELVIVRVDARPMDVLTAEMVVAETAEREDEPSLDEIDYLRGVERRAASKWPRVPVHTQLRSGPPAEAIATAATACGAALVVMATHGRTGVQRALVGSIAGRVLERDTAPLVVISPLAGATITAGDADANELRNLR